MQEHSDPVPAGPARTRIAWYRSPLPEDALHALMARSNLQGTLYALLHFGLLLATGAACVALAREGWWLALLPALVVHGACYGFLGYAGLGHELVHRTVFAARAPNDLLFALVSFLTWNNPHYFRKSHVLHHQFTVHEGIDGEVRLPQASVLGQWPALVFFDAGFFLRALQIGWQNARGVVKGEFGQRMFPEGSAERARLVAWARLMLAGHAALAVLFIASGWWVLVAVVNLAPFFGTLPSRALAQAQHYGMQPNTADFRTCSRTVVLHPFIAFLYWQMNYHVEHHMYPAVPFFRLRALHQSIAADLPPPTRGMAAVLRLLR